MTSELTTKVPTKPGWYFAQWTMGEPMKPMYVSCPRTGVLGVSDREGGLLFKLTAVVEWGPCLDDLVDENARLRAALDEMQRERHEARSFARVLVHAYDNDNRPPTQMLADIRAWSDPLRLPESST